MLQFSDSISHASAKFSLFLSFNFFVLVEAMMILLQTQLIMRSSLVEDQGKVVITLSELSVALFSSPYG